MHSIALILRRCKGFEDFFIVRFFVSPQLYFAIILALFDSDCNIIASGSASVFRMFRIALSRRFFVRTYY
nr:MAG TPA: hypothetical protein [Caudoviricetes sp.]